MRSEVGGQTSEVGQILTSDIRPPISVFFTFAFLHQSALPQILGLAGLLGNPARQDEEKIAEAIDVLDDARIDFFRRAIAAGSRVRRAGRPYGIDADKPQRAHRQAK